MRLSASLPLALVLLVGCPADDTDTDVDTGSDVGTEADSDSESDSDSEADSDSDADTDTDADTEADTDNGIGMDVGPFEDLVFYGSGCSDELWGDWRNAEDFILLGFAVDNAQGQRQRSTTYFNNLSFVDGELDTFLFFDNGDWSAQDWSYGFDFSGRTDVAVTAPVIAELPPATNRITVNSVTDVVDLEIQVTPNFSGSIQRIRLYTDAECWRSTVTYLTAPTLTGGVELSIPDLPNIAAGTWYMTIEGFDTDIGYTFYDVVQVEIP